MVPEKLEGFIREEAEKSGYKLVDVLARGNRGGSFEIVLDKEGGISAEECGEFNRKVMSWIDEQNMFESGYMLDVCSPGLDRVLKSKNEFLWAVGKDIEVRMHEPMADRHMIVGKLMKIDDKECVFLEETDGNKVCIDRNNIAKARLWLSI